MKSQESIKGHGSHDRNIDICLVTFVLSSLTTDTILNEFVEIIDFKSPINSSLLEPKFSRLFA